MRHLSHSQPILNGALGVDKLHEGIYSTIEIEAIFSGQSVGALIHFIFISECRADDRILGTRSRGLIEKLARKSET